MSDDEKLRRARGKALTYACRNLLGAEVAQIEYPGGRTRESYLLHLTDGRLIIGTQRDSDVRTSTECRILRALADGNVPAPKLLGTDGHRILLQEALPGRRLSVALQAAADSGERCRLLDSALDGLRLAQQAAGRSDVENSLPALGTERKWIRALIERPAVIGEYLKVATPKLDRDALVSLLQPATPRFVKWDARPGNALVDESGRVSWFDWEHAGLRHPLDDMAWLLVDEYVPDDVQVEARLLTRHVGLFAPEMNATAATEYLMTFGTFHMAVRLGLILKYMDGQWWDLQRCLERDKVGVTLACAQTLCTRGARWAAATPLTAPLAGWYESIGEKIVKL